MHQKPEDTGKTNWPRIPGQAGPPGSLGHMDTSPMTENRRKRTGRGQLDVNELLKTRCDQLHSIEP